MATDSISSRLTLTGNVKAPRYVFGTGGIAKPEPIHHALDEGYRAFDTAQQYGNEKEVGEAIRSYSGKVPREELFIITKVNVPGATVEETLEGIKKSVETIGLGGYVDLFLIHNPNSGPEGRKIQWLALEQAKKLGLAKAIGVSNFVIRHLDEMKEYASEVPAVNQVELSPFNQLPALSKYSADRGIALQAFAPVARGQKKDDPVLQKVAQEIGRSWSHVMLRYAWQKGYMITCKSETPSRISDNVHIFDFSLSAEQMTQLDELECNFRVTPSTLKDPKDRSVYYENMP